MYTYWNKVHWIRVWTAECMAFDQRVNRWGRSTSLQHQSARCSIWSACDLLLWQFRTTMVCSVRRTMMMMTMMMMMMIRGNTPLWCISIHVVDFCSNNCGNVPRSLFFFSPFELHIYTFFILGKFTKVARPLLRRGRAIVQTPRILFVPTGWEWSTGCLHQYLRRDNPLLYSTVV